MPEMEVWLCNSPVETHQDFVRPFITDDGNFFLLCYDGREVWLHPDDVGTERFHYLTDDGVQAGDVFIAPRRFRLAELHELDQSGWDVEWNVREKPPAYVDPRRHDRIKKKSEG